METATRKLRIEIIIAIITVVICICIRAICTYELDAVVVANHNGDITIEDVNGNLWKMTDENISEGTPVEITLSTGYTATIYDDAIINIKEK